MLTDDPRVVLHQAGRYLATEPVRHNLVLTLLEARVALPVPGRYVIVSRGDDVVGVAFQSPLDYPPTLTAMADDAVEAAVDILADAELALPGVFGEAATAARFAGQWTERTKSAASPTGGLRIYEVVEVRPPAGVDGELRPATTDDRAQVLEWVQEFRAETGDGDDDEAVLDRRLAAGGFWLWHDQGVVRSMAALTEPVGGVTRVFAVYTPRAGRGAGYAAAGVAELSRRAHDRGLRCMLYTDLGNPTSNSVYRRIGYRAVAEVLRYRFD